MPSPTVTSLHKSFNFVSNKAKGQISNFPKNERFLPPYQRVRNVCFSKNLECLVFLKHPFWDSPFSFITNDLPLPPEKNMNLHYFPSLKRKWLSCKWTSEFPKKNPKINHFIKTFYSMQKLQYQALAKQKVNRYIKTKWKYYEIVWNKPNVWFKFDFSHLSIAKQICHSWYATGDNWKEFL